MSILSDRWIREQARASQMIEPFVEAQRREGCISYGLSSYGSVSYTHLTLPTNREV